MRRLLLLTVIGVAFAPSRVRAEPIEVGGMLGPRLFADDSILGNNEMSPTSLGDSVLLGLRGARPITPWLVPEVELAISPAVTKDYDIDVFWFEPRAHIRFQLRPDRRIRPFAVLGGGLPVVLSSRRGIYPGGATGEAYGGAGFGWNPGRGVALRLDARFSLFQGRGGEKPVTVEAEMTAGVWFVIGKKGATRIRETEKPKVPIITDADGDGYDDVVDACPDRAEDHDGYDDKDGCPDIDNDGDQVLDVADKCATVSETYNGFEDDDGCPDTVHADVDLIIGTVEGLLYSPGEITVRASANDGLDRIVRVLKEHPSVRLLLVGHTDAKEAQPPADPPAPPEGTEPEPPAEPAELAMELGRNRAAALRNALMKRGGLPKGRFIIETRGLEEPVSDEDTNRGRLRNRRVEVKLFVPKR
jgi:outer membrane protein OmpA-like peptidoglycan-associated protein